MPTDSYQLATLVATGAADVAFSPDLTRLYVARANGNIDVFDVATHQLIDSWDIGTQLGAISVSGDGAFLLVVERQPLDGKSTLYRVDTGTGAKTAFSKNGSAFLDVEIVDADTALLTGGQDSVTLFNPLTSGFSSLSGGIYYGNMSVLNEDSRYTLFAEPYISNGPLFLYDDLLGEIVADGDTYEGGGAGFNFGSQAISEQAGLVVQFNYNGSPALRVYDLDLDFQQLVPIADNVAGLAFDDTGKCLYAFLPESSVVIKYDSSTWAEIDRYDVGRADWHNDIGYGNQLLIGEDGRYISVLHEKVGSGKLQLIDFAAGDETLVGTPGDDVLDGLGGNDVLEGRGGNDWLDGGAGADRTLGGPGNDIHIVRQAGDVVVEALNEGIDEVRTSLASFSLGGTQIENLTGFGSLDQILSGNPAANVLNGGAGADSLKGGAGDDTYIVDNLLDQVIEASGGGTDTIRASVEWTLPDQVENLTLTGTGDLAGSGNDLANVLTGNGGDNRLDGKAGADRMMGGKGHDVYVVGQAGDQAVESGSSGTDTVESRISFTLPVHVEKLVLIGSAALIGRGNAGDNRVTGNGVANVLSGGRGEDRIDGGGSNDQIFGGDGSDLLSGGSGGDRFYFNAAPGSLNVDRILDYSAAADTLYLDRSIFTVAGANGTLAAGAFRQGTAAADASDRILYDQATGKIFYDSDGTGAGAAILFATVAAGTPLTHADFVIYG